MPRSKGAARRRRPCVQSTRVGRQEALVGPNAAQRGPGLREARGARVSLRAGRQEAAHPKWVLGRHYGGAPDRGLVGPLACRQRRRPHRGPQRPAGPGRRPEGRRLREPRPPRARERSAPRDCEGPHRRRRRARFLRVPGGETVRNSAGTLGAGLDVRGEGGYVVVPPSRTRSAYEWIDRSPPAEPKWLLTRLREHAGGETLF